MRQVELGWSMLGLLALGCPLLVDNRLQVVDEVTAGSAGAPPVEPPEPSAGAPPSVSVGGGGGERSACGSVSTPRPSGSCPPVCDRCEGGYCVFDCSDDEVCQDRPLDCPPDWACRVSCSAQAACSKARIACPAELACDVQCLEVDSCKEAVVTCATGDCHVRCDVENACEKTKVTCSTGHCAAECPAEAHHPMLACGDACGCDPC